ncbi:MAG: hypothetical protein J7L47_05005 [Candidatus Odinarchaeota archaeon]|nr:hypothetical protein [Candidatus Odinarchaeota archaeon]
MIVEEIIKFLAENINRTAIVSSAILFGIFYTIVALLKKATKTATEKIIENKGSAGLYLLGFFGVLMILFASDVSSYTGVDYWYIVACGAILTIVGLIKIIFRGATYVKGKGIKSL